MSSGWRVAAEKTLGWLVRLEQVLAVGLLATILLAMGAQVIARYVFGAPLSWSEEVARLAMIWLTFIAASFVAAKREHIAVDLYGAGPATAEGAKPQTGFVARCLARIFDRRVASIVVLFTTSLMLLGGLRFVWRVYPVGSPSIGISKSFWYGAATVGLALISLHTLTDLVGLRPRLPLAGKRPADLGERALQEGSH
jgi:TRAP-type C4-dicarboxylate transport system permease small subunit